MSVRILLADDHHLVRQALRAFLESEDDFELVGESGDGLEVLRDVERLQPEILLLDLMMPGLNGLEVTRQVAQRCPRTRVIILSMHADEGYVLKALQNGAFGYVLKQSQVEDLVLGVREVAAGRRYLSPPLTDRAIESYIRKSESESFDVYETLTTRERGVLQLVAEGHTNAEVAKRLFISPRTVETHRGHVMRKLGLKNQAELIRFAIERGIVAVDR